METIKKYNNRKLYSTTLSDYVPLEYIADLKNLGQKYRVVDNTTKTDITYQVTKKALLEKLQKVGISNEDLVGLLKGTSVGKSAE